MELTKATALFLPLLFVVAFLYSSVGHGGASGYLALMALFGFAPTLMKSSALMLNIGVSFISFYQYYKAGYFKWKLFFPFVITSIPLSFAGALITVDGVVYKKILGLLLFFPILRLLGFLGNETNEEKPLHLPTALIIGGIIGLLSGMIGIGGGIILSPVLLLLHWAKMKETAAVSALFIFVNSISGIIALSVKGIVIETQVYYWFAIALLGGLAGAYWGQSNKNNLLLKRTLAFVLIIASVKLFFV